MAEPVDVIDVLAERRLPSGNAVPGGGLAAAGAVLVVELIAGHKVFRSLNWVFESGDVDEVACSEIELPVAERLVGYLETSTYSPIGQPHLRPPVGRWE